MAGATPPNPYLDAYAAQESAFSTESGRTLRQSRRAARRARIAKQYEQSQKATEAQSKPFGVVAPPTQLEKRQAEYIKPLADAVSRGEAPDQDAITSFIRGSNPLLLQQELDAEQEQVEAEKQFWTAVEGGSQEAIDAVLPEVGKRWDSLRESRAEFAQVEEQFKAMDPVADAGKINRLREELDLGYKRISEEEEKLKAYHDRILKGIETRRVGGVEESRRIGTPGWITAFSKIIAPQIHLAAKVIDSPDFQPGAASDTIAAPTMKFVGETLQRPQRGVASSLGTIEDILTGKDDWKLRDLNAWLAMITDSGQARGAEASEVWGERLAPTFNATSAVLAKGLKLGEEAYHPLAYLGGQVLDAVSGVEAPTRPSGMSDEDWAKIETAWEGSGGLSTLWTDSGNEAARRGAYAKAAGQTAFELLTDPLSIVDIPFGKILKPLEPFADKLSSMFKIKGAAQAFRKKILGGALIEDPVWGKWDIARKAAEVEAATPFVEEAFKARKAVKEALDSLPQELHKPVQDASVKLREIPKKLEGKVVFGGDDAANMAHYDNVEARMQARRQALEGIPPEHRNKAVAYADLLEKDAKLRAALADKHGLVLELSDDSKIGYAARRFSPEYQLYLAQHPEVEQAFIDKKLPQGEGRVSHELTADQMESFLRTRSGDYKGDIWDRNQANVSFGDWLFAANAVKRVKDMDEFIKAFGVRPGVDDNTRAMNIMQRVLSSREEQAAIALERAAGAAADVTNLGAARKVARPAVSAQRRSVSKLIDLADAANADARASSATRAIAGEAKDISAIKSPRLKEVEDAFTDFTSDLVKRTHGWYGGTAAPDAVEAAIKQLQKDMGDVKASYFATGPKSLDEFYRVAYEYQAKVLPQYRKVLKNFASELRASAGKGPGRKAITAIASDVDAALTQLDRLATIETAVTSKGIGAAVRARAAKLEESAGAAVARADFHNMTNAEQAATIKAALRRAGIAPPKGYVSAFDAMESAGIKLGDNHKLYDELVELATTFVPEHRLAEFKDMFKTATPSVLRARVNRLAAFVSKSLLANPASLIKDIKGQVINAAMTDPNLIKFMPDATAMVTGRALPDKDYAELMASGLARPSFESEIAPSVIKATSEFGGGTTGRIAGAIDESGFIGGSIRGIGKGLEAAGLPRVGRGVQTGGKGVGRVGRELLNARQHSEEVFRLATYKAAKARGLSTTDALHEVAKYWGDFSQLSKLESHVLRGFVLFFSWQLRALKIGMHQIVDHPLRTRLMLSLAAGNVSGDPSFEDWAQRQGGSIIGTDAAGNAKMMSIVAGSYLEPGQDLLQGEIMQRLRTDGIGGVPKGIAQTALRRLVPALQAPFEYATNYDSFSGNQIHLEPGQDTRTRTSDHAPAAFYWIAQKFPTIGEWLDIRPVKDTKTGNLRYIHMDPTKNWLFNKVMPGVGAQMTPLNAAADPRKDLWESASRLLGFPTYALHKQGVREQVGKHVREGLDVIRPLAPKLGLYVDARGVVGPDLSSDIGRQVAEDNVRWEQEAKDLGKNPDAYKRFKMGAKYQHQLYLIDLSMYLRGWKDLADNPLPDFKGLTPAKDPLRGLRRLGRDEAKRDLRRR